MNKLLSAAGTILVVQAALIGGYLLISEQRRTESDAPAAAVPEVIASPLPDLVVRYADGSSGNLAGRRGRPLLLHFWATWCPPCRKELPGLIALAEKGGAPILLVALDKDWKEVRGFFDGPIPPFIALADGSQVENRFGVQALPESFVVDRAGEMTLRFRGPQDWTAAATLMLLPKELK